MDGDNTDCEKSVEEESGPSAEDASEDTEVKPSALVVEISVDEETGALKDNEVVEGVAGEE